MKSIQHKRKESILFREVSLILSEKIENVNISYITVTEIDLSSDQSVLKIYVTFENNKNKSFEYLQNTKGFVKSEIAKISGLRRIPNIVFKLDDTSEKAKKIEEILKKIKGQ